MAVELDGDLPGAQKLGARLKVRGYPTLVLFSPEGSEITRLPGEADPTAVLKLLQIGLAGGRSVEALLADVRSARPLTANEWRMLAFHSWDTADAAAAPPVDRAGLLATLAAACPPSETQTQTRLWLKALAASDTNTGAGGAKPDSQLRQRVLGLLADSMATRLHMDVLANAAVEVTKALDTTGARAEVTQKFDRALRRLAADGTLSRADRMTALHARVELARLGPAPGGPDRKLPEALLREVREQASRADREITDAHERQAVITAASHVLGRAGLADDSDALLQANLTRSHSPYYLMSQLAGNAKQRGDKAGALLWYQRAFEASQGPATRLQWGASYLAALVDLAPDDAPRIEQAAARLFGEAAAERAAFHERGARSLQRAAEKLKSWNRDGKQAAALQRLKTQLDAVCRNLDVADPQRAVCEGLLSGAPAAASS